MVNWKKVNDALPEDGEPIWVLNKEIMKYWERDLVATQYKYMIYDAFFERGKGWVLMNDTPDTRINVCFWSYKELPEDPND